MLDAVSHLFGNTEKDTQNKSLCFVFVAWLSDLSGILNRYIEKHQHIALHRLPLHFARGKYVGFGEPWGLVEIGHNIKSYRRDENSTFQWSVKDTLMH